jgi:hypothetical protein
MRKLREAPAPPPLNQPPRITKIADLAIEVDEVGTVELGVSDESVPAVRVSAESLNPSLIPAAGLTLKGSGAERLLTVAPVPGKTGEALVTVAATDADGLTDSKEIAVFVLPIVPAIGVAGPPTGSAGVVYDPAVRQTGFSGAGTPSSVSGPVLGQQAAANSAFVPTANGGFSGMFGRCFQNALQPGGVNQVSQPSSTTAGAPAAFGLGTRSFSSDIFAVRSISNSQFVARDDLIAGRTSRDAESLLSRGYEAFWSGNYPAAAELFAAAAEVSDDASAWTFLALSSMMTGDDRTARRAARYAAAKAITSPTIERSVSQDLIRVQGPLRRQLIDLQAVVSGRRIANAILDSRPKLIAQRVP